MKKTINNVTCDTDMATLHSFKYHGEFGCPHGYEESLYITEDKYYFLYGVGGEESPYPKEKIKLLTCAEVEKWIKENNTD